MYLVDTNVLSALSPSARAAHRELGDWIEANADMIYLSCVTASEIVAGIVKAERIGASTKQRGLRDWWAGIQELYGGRILPLDLEVAMIAGEMIDLARAHDPGYEDIAIAATARVHDLTVLTRNERHFAVLQVPFLNPFDSLPGGVR